MNWYYISERRKTGPVNDAELVELVRQGRITDATPVWNELTSRWQPFQNVKKSVPGLPQDVQPQPVAPAVAEVPVDESREDELKLDEQAQETASESETDRAYCVECGRNFSVDDLIHYENLTICADCKTKFFQKIREGASVSSTMEYAGFWIRVAAKVIDRIIMGFAEMIIYFIFMIPVGIITASNKASGQGVVAVMFLMAVYFLAQLAINAAYATFFVGKFGATPGKMACNIRIVTADGGKVSYARALGRHFATMLSALILGIGYLMVAFDDEKRGLHDRICNTRVVKK